MLLDTSDPMSLDPESKDPIHIEVKPVVRAPIVFPKDAQITQACPKCKYEGILITRHTQPRSYVVVCMRCRIHVSAEVASSDEAIYWWNELGGATLEQATQLDWPVWRADLPGDDQRKRLPLVATYERTMPDLSNYVGVC